MTKTVRVRWMGGKDDPASIVQYGIRFEKWKWTEVPEDDAGARQYRNRMQSFRDNQWFEVEGQTPTPHSADGQVSPQPIAPAPQSPTVNKPRSTEAEQNNPAAKR